MVHTVILTLVSVFVVSLVSMIGIITLFRRWKNLDNVLLMLVSLSAGTLFGGAFLHLLPEAVEKDGFTLQVSILLVAGVFTFFLLEKFIHWHHCHNYNHLHPEHLKLHKDHEHKHLAAINLVGDGLHNLIDGLVIAGSYFVSVNAGIATTIAVIIHEIPQEIADFGVLLYAGMKRWKALLYNLFSAGLAIIGAILGLILGARSEVFVQTILPFAAGGFVYIAGSNLIPELHKECGMKDSLWHILIFLSGIIIMLLLLFLEF